MTGPLQSRLEETDRVRYNGRAFSLTAAFHMTRTQLTTPRRTVDRVTQPTGVVVHALHKSATMFLYEFFRRVSADRGWQYFSINNHQPNESELNEWTDTGFCHCPVRSFEIGSASYPQVARVYRIFQLRDPRDMLVSEYFSVGWIHPDHNWGDEQLRWRETVQAMSVDEYVLGQPQFSRYPLETRLRPLHDIDFNQETNIVVKYEQMVSCFRKWAATAVQPFGFRWPKLAAARYAWIYRNEFSINGEAMTHKRRIIPGDYKQKLKPDTIRALNRRFEQTLTRFGYRH